MDCDSVVLSRKTHAKGYEFLSGSGLLSMLKFLGQRPADTATDQKKVSGKGHGIRKPKEFYSHLQSLEFKPATVFDVGVAWGTPDLYEAFPDAYYYLFEALPSFEPSLQSILKTLKGEYHVVALSSDVGSRTIYVGREPIRLAGASIFHRQATAGGEEVTVQLRRLDDLIDCGSFAQPALIKIDAQGADIEVLRGGKKVIQQCDVIIAETGLYPFRNPDNQTHNVIGYMSTIGFVPYDFLSPLRRPYDDALGQIDVVFVKSDGLFRRYSSWA